MTTIVVDENLDPFLSIALDWPLAFAIRERPVRVVRDVGLNCVRLPSTQSIEFSIFDKIPMPVHDSVLNE